MQENEIKGVWIGNLFLLAHDVTLYIKNPKESLKDY
jgi:hypothetical protein